MFWIGCLVGLLVGVAIMQLFNELYAARARREEEQERRERPTKIGFAVTQTYEDRVAALKKQRTQKP